MAPERKDALSGLSLFPKTKQQLEEVPELLKQSFSPHLTFIREAQKFWAEGQRKGGQVRLRSEVVHAETRRGNTFTFYSESEKLDRRKTMEISLDRGLNDIVGVKISLQVAEGHNPDQLQRIFTDINLQDGFRLEQDVDHIPLLAPPFSVRQLFVLDARLYELASLLWIINGTDHPIFTISSNNQKFMQPLRMDIATGKFFLEIANTTLPYTFPSPDEFLSQAIRDILDLKPVHFSP